MIIFLSKNLVFNVLFSYKFIILLNKNKNFNCSPLKDKVDDVIIGIKSTALRFGDNTKVWLAAFSTTMLSGLLTSGYVCDQTWPYYVSIGLVGAHLARQCFSLKINDPGDCARKFISNYQVGFIIFIGIIIGNCIKSKQEVKATPNLQPTSTYIDMTNKKLHLT